VCERDLASAGCLVSVDRNTIAMSLRQMDTLHIHEQGALHAGIALRLTREINSSPESRRKWQWVRIF